MRVAIVGAGYLGSAVATALPPPVVVTTRSGAWRSGDVPPGVTVRTLDVSRPVEPDVLAGSDALVVCFAPGQGQDREALYVEGTRRLLRVLDDRALRRVVYTGSTSALADVDAWVDETDAREPQSERGLVQRRAEHEVAAAAQRSGTPWLILRLGGLYGPGRGLDRVYRRRAAGPLPGDGNAPTNLIHRDDAVAAVLAALRAPPDVTGIVHVVDDDHTPRRAMYARVAALRDLDPVQFEAQARPGAPPRGKRVCNARLKFELGVRLRYPLHALEAL